MNIAALMAALVGVILMSITVHFGNKLENRWLRYLAAAAGLIGSIVVTSLVPGLFGDASNDTSALAGSYLVALIVAVVVLKSLFFRKKSAPESA
jgi:H+/Cl- antiporter ClcA